MEIMKNPWDDVIIEGRVKVVKDMILQKGKHYHIRKDLKAGKLIFKKKECTMETLHNTNYLQYDTRTVSV